MWDAANNRDSVSALTISSMDSGGGLSPAGLPTSRLCNSAYWVPTASSSQNSSSHPSKNAIILATKMTKSRAFVILQPLWEAV